MRYGVLLALLLVAALAAGRVQKSPRDQATSLTITAFSPSSYIISYCPFSSANCDPADRRLRLNTIVKAANGSGLKFTYTPSAGKIEGEGSSVIWDLTSAGFGEHTVKVLVDNAKHERATADLTVRIVECGICDPPRESVICPSISVSCPSQIEKGKPITFVATVTGGAPDLHATYSWSTTAGEIVEGKYDNRMMLDLKGFPFENVTATVRVSGYDPSCAVTASCTTAIKE